MKTMIVGNGGREHAMALSFAKSGAEQYYSAPNPGMLEVGGVDLRANTLDKIVDAVVANHIGFVAIGPEEPLAAGLSDQLRAERIAVFGPSRKASQLESSKIYAHHFNRGANIPQPKTFAPSDVFEARRFAARHVPDSYVIKADGLMSGKGVFLPELQVDAQQSITELSKGLTPEGPRRRVIFQERLHGPEVSMLAVVDGKKMRVLPLAQDHKRLLDGDGGPNTGGMGAYAPVPDSIVSKDQLEKMLTIAEQMLDGLDKFKISYRGVLYFGFILAEERGGDPVVIEYNARLGDPEAQAVLTLLDSQTDVHELFYSAAIGELGGGDRVSMLEYTGKCAVTHTLAAASYPGSVRTGRIVHGLDRDYEGVVVHHGATRLDQKGRVLSNGGRVLYVTGVGETIDEASAFATAAIGRDAIHFSKMQYRSDIGWQARQRK